MVHGTRIKKFFLYQTTIKRKFRLKISRDSTMLQRNFYFYNSLKYEKIK